MPSRSEAGLLAADWLRLLTPHGTLMILEPALRETSRSLHQVRDQLLQDKSVHRLQSLSSREELPSLARPERLVP